ncbi:MAG: hypothetical protein ACOY4K_00670 [Pseudomonadota bacterium]
MTIRLTTRILRAMEEAVCAMLAGECGQGDWPEHLPRDDLEDAAEWLLQQIDRRESGRND